jgi:hypothetical protein
MDKGLTANYQRPKVKANKKYLFFASVFCAPKSIFVFFFIQYLGVTAGIEPAT